MVAPLLRTLVRLHAQHILHRDIKVRLPLCFPTLQHMLSCTRLLEW